MTLTLLSSAADRIGPSASNRPARTTQHSAPPTNVDDSSFVRRDRMRDRMLANPPLQTDGRVGRCPPSRARR
jgi:hypothetical protein